MLNKKWIYTSRPENRVTSSNYELQESTLDESLAVNEVIVKMVYISVDPYMRIQQSSRNTWETPHPLGVVQGGGTVGQIVASASNTLSIGDWVVGYLGWQKFAKCHFSDVKKIETSNTSPSAYLGVLGMPGRTAWFGLMEAGRPKPGISAM
jgi:NADPH-dependent curcumin reductase CurA